LAARSLSRQVRGAVLAAGIAAALGGCVTSVGPTIKPEQAQLASVSPPDVGAAPVSSGIFQPITASAGKLEGEALRKAQLNVADAIADAGVSSVVITPAAAPASQPADAPPQAVKYYLQARAKYAEGARAEAMDLLRRANQLDPKSFPILSLMGQISFVNNQLSTGSMYLKEAHMLRPADVETSALLGRYFVELKEWPTAIWLLGTADASKERIRNSPTEAKVVFHLARALHAGGYYMAAAESFERFLGMMGTAITAYRYDPELVFLNNDDWAIRLMAAEDYAALGQLNKALPHYRAASAGVMKRPIDNDGKAYVLSREIVALARLKQSPEQLMQSALKLVGPTRGSEQSIELLAWVARQVGKEDAALALLEKEALKDENENGGYTVLALSGVQERFGHKEAALASLEKYFLHKATETAVLDRLVRLAEELKRPAVAFGALAAALDADPERAAEIRRQLFVLAGDHPTMEQVHTFEKDAPRGTPGMQGKSKYLLALLAEAADDPQSSQDYLAEAVKIDPGFWPSREAYVAVLLSTDQFTLATRFVQEAIDHKQGGAKAYQLKIESEAGQGRWSAALKVAQDAKKMYPDVPEIAHQVVQIRIARYERQKASEEIGELLKKFPKFEDGYKTAIELALTMRDRDGAFNLIGDLMREVPASQYGTIFVATYYADTGQADKAEILLRRLVSEKPGDVEANAALAGLLKSQERATEALKLIEDAFRAHPSPGLAAANCELLRAMNRRGDALALAKKLAADHPNSESWSLLVVTELVAQDKKDDAEAYLRQTAEKFPRSSSTIVRLCRYLSANNKSADAVAALLKFNDRNGATAERLYLLGHLYNETGEDDKSTAALEKVLEINPDHTGACNDLGYFWVDKGRNLPRAEALIRKAVDNQPLNPAFVDSLGWVLYKQNKIPAAVEQLEKAVSLPGGMEPEVIGHLGDAFFRAGKKDQAIQQWQRALRILQNTPRKIPDHEKLVDQFQRQIRQASRDEEVDVAPLAPPEKSTSASGENPKAK
jgi:tetratricopeptide (TPR) repeat protein